MKRLCNSDHYIVERSIKTQIGAFENGPHAASHGQPVDASSMPAIVARSQSVDIYTFVVENFIIHDTRALHSDTLYLYYSAYLDGDLVANHLISMGDLDN